MPDKLIATKHKRVSQSGIEHGDRVIIAFEGRVSGIRRELGRDMLLVQVDGEPYAYPVSVEHAIYRVKPHITPWFDFIQWIRERKHAQ